VPSGQESPAPAVFSLAVFNVVKFDAPAEAQAMNMITRDSGERHDRTAERFAAQKFTWKSIKEAISPAAFENPTHRGLLYFFRDIVLFAACMVALYYAEAWYFVLPLWFLSGLIISALFAIGHDSAHGALFKSKRLSYLVGQISMLPSLHAYHQWAYGHNRVHHGHTIKLNGDFVWHPVSPGQYRKMSRFGRTMHRTYWSPFGAGVYYLFEIWLKGMILYSAPTPEARRDQRMIIGLALSLSAAWVYVGATAAGTGFDVAAGLWMWTKMAALPFLVWNYFIGVTVYLHHIHDDIPWKARGDWSPAYGQLFGTVNYHIPKVMNFFLHNIYIHMPHHVHVKIPFYNLGRALNDIKAVYGDYVVERSTAVRDYLHSTKRCKLFDAESGRWYTYREARSIGV
jgi:omega-6 fatty acid desaturase (delta-12 desaturase)